MRRFLLYAAVPAGAVALAAIAGAAILADEPTVTYVAEAHGHAYLGVRVEEEVDHPEGGARIEAVIEDSPAERAGLETGDIIVRFGDVTVRGPQALTRQIREREPGETVDIGIVRDGKKRTVTAELGEPGPGVWNVAPEFEFDFQMDEEALAEQMRELQERLKEMEFTVPLPNAGHLFFAGSRPKLGVQLVEATPELRVHLGGREDVGVLVGKVLPDTPAERAGVLVGDLIVALDGEDVATTRDLIRALEGSEGATVRVEVVRDGKLRTLDAEIPEPEEDEITGPRARLLDDPAEAAELRRAALEADARRALEDARRVQREAAERLRGDLRDARRDAVESARDAYRRAVEIERLRAAALRGSV